MRWILLLIGKRIFTENQLAQGTMGDVWLSAGAALSGGKQRRDSFPRDWMEALPPRSARNGCDPAGMTGLGMFRMLRCLTIET